MHPHLGSLLTQETSVRDSACRRSNFFNKGARLGGALFYVKKRPTIAGRYLRVKFLTLLFKKQKSE
jgi:hypothetical protein